jgi:hypothetical protein
MALVRAEISEEYIACFITVTITGELGTKLAVTSNRSTQSNIIEDGILHSHRCENLK